MVTGGVYEIGLATAGIYETPERLDLDLHNDRIFNRGSWSWAIGDLCLPDCQCSFSPVHSRVICSGGGGAFFWHQPGGFSVP